MHPESDSEEDRAREVADHLLDGHPLLKVAVAHAEILAAFIGVMDASAFDWPTRDR